MANTLNISRRAGYSTTIVALFLCLFAGQAAVIAMSPVLADAAADLHVSTAAAGQLRALTGLAAGVSAVLLGVFRGRSLARRLLVGCALVGVGSLASAGAPSFGVLALAQLPIGVGVAVVTSGATLAAAEWVAPELRTRALSWVLIGQPAAWIVGMPLVGFLGGWSWRYGWIALPTVAAAAAAIILSRRPAQAVTQTAASRARAALRDGALARYLGSELFANAAWAGTLVYAGALLAESYGTSMTATGALLSLAAAAYVAGNVSSRRLTRRDSGPVLIALAVALAVAVAAFGAARPGVGVSTLLFSGAAFLAGARTLVSNAFALAAPAEVRPALTSLRAATMQFGYLIGSVVSGGALAFGGYGALGVAMGALFAGCAATLAWRPRRRTQSAERLPTAIPALYGSQGVSGNRRPLNWSEQPRRKEQHMDPHLIHAVIRILSAERRDDERRRAPRAASARRGRRQDRSATASAAA